MIGKIMKLIFMDRKGRAAAEKLREGRESAASQEPEAETQESAATEDEPPVEEEPPVADEDREILLAQAMALYRKRRAEYEQLDESVQAKLAKLAGDHLGTKDKQPE